MLSPMAKVKLLTQKEYAAHRGCSAPAVHKAVKAGRISMIGDRIDPAVADIQWQQNSRARVRSGASPAPAGQPGATSSTPASAGDLVDRAQVDPASSSEEPGGESGAASGEGGQLQADPGYQASRSRQAAADARTAEIKLAELEGTLVRIDQVKAQLAAMLAPVREGLLQIPARLAPLLAPQSDAGRIQTLLEVEIHQVLAPLAKVSGLVVVAAVPAGSADAA
jgi:hypothetical protein